LAKIIQLLPVEEVTELNNKGGFPVKSQLQRLEVLATSTRGIMNRKSFMDEDALGPHVQVHIGVVS